MTPDSAIFGEWLRGKRESAGLSQRACARLSEIDEGGFRKIEKGQILPSPANLEGLADVKELGVTYAEMLDVVVADKAQRERLRYERARAAMLSVETKSRTPKPIPHRGDVAAGGYTDNPEHEGDVP